MSVEPAQPDETLQVRSEGPESAPTLIYLPGLHGDWTLVTPFRSEIRGRVRFVEITYPRSITWTLDDYAREIIVELERLKISSGWLLAESFGSQVAWAIVRRFSISTIASPFKLEGIILAGGFIAYPMKPAVRWLATRRTLRPRRGVSPSMWLYAALLRLRFFRSPEHRSAAREFLARRTPQDARAMLKRMYLIIDHDPTEAAAQLSVPLYYLSGFIDPIVPWFLIRPELRRRCPAFRSSRIIFTADHNVLGTAPRTSARQILAWLQSP